MAPVLFWLQNYKRRKKPVNNCIFNVPHQPKHILHPFNPWLSEMSPGTQDTFSLFSILTFDFFSEDKFNKFDYCTKSFHVLTFSFPANIVTHLIFLLISLWIYCNFLKCFGCFPRKFKTIHPTSAEVKSLVSLSVFWQEKRFPQNFCISSLLSLLLLQIKIFKLSPTSSRRFCTALVSGCRNNFVLIYSAPFLSSPVIGSHCWKPAQTPSLILVCDASLLW